MKEQVFKFSHMTVVYHGGGQYTLTADDGYVLQSGDKQVREVKTKDYTQWHAIEAPADEKPKKKSKPRTIKRPISIEPQK